MIKLSVLNESDTTQDRDTSKSAHSHTHTKGLGQSAANIQTYAILHILNKFESA